MAKSVEILTKENTAKVVVDNNEIHDVLSYTLFEDAKSRTLTLSIAVTDEIAVQL